MELNAQEQKLLDQLRASSIRIPPRPQILHDIDSMLKDDNSTERMIGQLVARDVGLTAEVFKIANSPAFRRGSKIDSIEQAVRMLGRKMMSGIARSALLRQQLGGDAAKLEVFWERCTDIGTLCSVLCDHLKRPGKLTADQAYLIGLFHDCGVPVLMQHIKGYGNAQFNTPLSPDFLQEDDDHGTSHCIAGLMVATEWELPDLLCEAIRSHHYVISEEQSAPHSVALLQLALHAYSRSNGWEDTEWPFQSAKALEVLGLTQDAVESMLDEALASFEVFH